MATSFILRTPKKIGTTTIVARLQRPELGIDLRQSTHLKTDIQAWTRGHMSPQALNNLRAKEKKTFALLDEIETELNARSKSGMTPAEMRGIIENIVYREQREDEARKAAEAKKETFMDYYKRFMDEARAGRIVTEKGTRYAPLTIRHFQQGYNKLQKYQMERGRLVDWDGIDMDFHKDYTEFLHGEGYSPNTIGSRFKEIKFLMGRARDEGKTSSDISQNKKFTANNNKDTDSVYLTREEVERIKNVNLHFLPAGYAAARDLFLVGIYTAQRCSDYLNIEPQDIKHRVLKRMKDDVIVEEDRLYIELIQQKTKNRVRIPVNSDLRAILDRYNNRLPKLSDVKLNAYIKEISKLAGIDEIIEVKSEKGGILTTSRIEKYKLVHSHTARRTGCTWMYLAGMDVYDICKISGHATPAMLKKYIKADGLDVVDKLTTEYDYFD